VEGRKKKGVREGIKYTLKKESFSLRRSKNKNDTSNTLL